jgi:hypothetical protein
MRGWTIPLLVVLGSSLGGHAFADDDVRSTPLNEAPRFTRSELSGDVQASPAGYAGETTELQGRWWTTQGRADLGLGLGTLGYGLRPTGSIAGLVGTGNTTVVASATVLTLGMRYRTSDRSAVFADASSLHGSTFEGNEAVFGKVGFELKSAQSAFHVSYGGLGMNLAGDAHMTVRPKHGGLALFMRTSF